MNDLMSAIKDANAEHALALLKSGVGTDNNRWLPHWMWKHEHTALGLAAEKGLVIIVKAIIERGGPVDEKDANGWTPLLHASRGNHAEIVHILCEAGASTELVGLFGKTALNWVAGLGHRDAMLVLMGYGANINAEDDYGWTPLMLASLCNYLEIVTILCTRGADVTVVKAGKTALSIAHTNGRNDIVSVIRAHGGY